MQQKKNLIALLGKGRAKKGMFLGNLEDGELEVGQISATMDTIKPAQKLLKK